MTEPKRPPCIPTEALGEVDALAADHRWRRHLADCPHCRALLAAYRSFLAGDAALADATREARLVSRLERELGGGPEAPGGAPAGRRVLPRWLAPALGAAALLLVAVGLWPTGRGPLPRLGDAVRGPVQRVDSLRVLSHPDGLLLRWQSPAGSERGKLLVVDAAITPLAEYALGDGDSLLLGSAQIDSLRGLAEVLYWSVRVETAAGAAESEPLELRLTR